jgi:hypothetical protein
MDLVAVIFGRKSIPSSTSKAEAIFDPSCWSSTQLRPQVVRPRRRRGGRRLWIFAGFESTSSIFSMISAFYASRSLAKGGGRSQGFDCFLLYFPRVLFAKLEPLSLIIRFSSAIDARGASCKLFLPLFSRFII